MFVAEEIVPVEVLDKFLVYNLKEFAYDTEEVDGPILRWG